MAIFKDEVELREWADPIHRALMLRDRADHFFIQVETEHERLFPPPGMATASRADELMVRRATDADFFFISLHRLTQVADLARKLADPRKALPFETCRGPCRLGVRVRR
jgi:hypothetical protein